MEWLLIEEFVVAGYARPGEPDADADVIRRVAGDRRLRAQPRRVVVGHVRRHLGSPEVRGTVTR